jgi:hypothetical protein
MLPIIHIFYQYPLTLLSSLIHTNLSPSSEESILQVITPPLLLQKNRPFSISYETSTCLSSPSELKMPVNRAAYQPAQKASSLEVKSAPYTSAPANGIVVKNRAVAINPVDCK